jgi:superfamily II DNA or RNA helicase
VNVSVVQTGWYPKGDVQTWDGTIDYMKVIDSMIHDEERFDAVFKAVSECRGGVIVLANRVEYLQRLCDLYTSGQFGEAICISGMGQSKKAKEERKTALNALNSGELDAIFATYQLAKEGLDVPNLRYVIFATPEKDETTVVQSAGRVGRKADGKECGEVIDFVDDFGIYKAWAKRREGYYKKIGAKIFKKI